jgi:hypothetical protein
MKNPDEAYIESKIQRGSSGVRCFPALRLRNDFEDWIIPPPEE